MRSSKGERPLPRTYRLLPLAAVALVMGAAFLQAPPAGLAVGSPVPRGDLTSPNPTQIADMSLGPVRDTNEISVRLFGDKGFRVRKIAESSLRLRSKGPGLASRWRQPERVIQAGDVNEDGYKDLRLLFRINLVARAENGHTHAHLTGVLRYGRVRTATRANTSWAVFSASDEITVSDDAIDYCSVGTDGFWVRCSFTQSLADSHEFTLSDLMTDMNAKLANAGYSSEVTTASDVQVEAWGGSGADGYTPSACSEHGGYGGSGGAGGYAQSAQTVAELEALGSALNVYVGQDGWDSQNGGSSTIVLGKSILDVTDTFDPVGQGVLVVAGGGGGGGKCYWSDEVIGGGPKNGHWGGHGGDAVATTSASVAADGQDAYGKHGYGGSDTTSVTTNDGQPGLGGFGSTDDGSGIGWTNSTVTLSDWSAGSGGASGSDGGGGGGYGGGGRGDKDDDNYSGGGGGGSWARQSTGFADSSYQVGQANYDEPALVLTFETLST